MTGIEPDGITLGAFDAVRVLANSVIRAGGPRASAKELGRAIFAVTATYACGAPPAFEGTIAGPTSLGNRRSRKAAEDTPDGGGAKI